MARKRKEENPSQPIASPITGYRPGSDLKAFLKATVLGAQPIMEIALEGEPGCGKTLATRWLHDQRGLPAENYHRLVCTKETSFTDFTIEKSIQGGNIVDLESRLLQLLDKPSTIVIDEYGLAQPDVMAGLNSILDFEKAITLPNGKKYQRHPQCLIVFTSNPRNYAGVKRQHGGFLDRLPTLQMGYAADELKILKEKFPGVDAEMLGRIVEFAKLVRNARRSKNLQTVCSTRGLETMANMLMNGADINTAVSAAIKPLPEEEQTINELSKLAMNATIVKGEDGEDTVSIVAGVKKELQEKTADLKTTQEELAKWKGRVEAIIKSVK